MGITSIRWWWVVALILGAGGEASAHQGQIRRTLMLEPAGPVLEVLVEVVVTGPERQAALLTMADRDRDGALQASELERVGQELALYGLDQLQVWSGTTALSLEGVETKVQAGRGQPIVALIHGRLPLSLGQGLILETGKSAAPLSVRIFPGAPALRASRGRAGKKGLVELELGARDRLELRLEAPQKGRNKGP